MLTNIKAIALDVDGVLTDGTFYWSSDGTESKRFSVTDATGIASAMHIGMPIALISGESSEDGMQLVQRYANKLNIQDVYKGCHDKAKAANDFVSKYNLSLSELCFIGDDIIDLSAIAIVGFSAAPNGAHPSVLEKVNFISSRKGGAGAVRETIDLILEKRTKNYSYEQKN